MAKEIAEKALDEYEYEGKTIRQWAEVLKEYDDEHTTLKKILEEIEDEFSYSKENFLKDEAIYRKGLKFAIRVIKKKIEEVNV